VGDRVQCDLIQKRTNYEKANRMVVKKRLDKI
jgi:hypothetical protein